MAWTGRSLRYRGARVPAPDSGLHCGWTGAQGLDAIRPRIPAVRREAELRPVGAHRIRAERPACSAVQRRAPLRLEKVALWVKKVWGMFPSFRRRAPLRRQGLGRDLRRQRGCSLCSPAGFHCTAGSIAASNTGPLSTLHGRCSRRSAAGSIAAGSSSGSTHPRTGSSRRSAAGSIKATNGRATTACRFSCSRDHSTFEVLPCRDARRLQER